ncbi:unnamed protein product [Adineta steineri]|uniref:Hint domain-containing protein n=1 Tax=Adineta steineri TaxID=433720 RepID=A0A818J1I5_9BILA|nr:unnamed protein product [Adineta steineri]
MFLAVTLFVVCLSSTIASSSGSYSTSCTCTQASVNGTFCWTWTCQTNQVTKCFAGDATVELSKTKQRKTMRNLNIGDEILVNIDEQGKRIYEPIYDFIHANHNGIYDYLKITVENNFQQQPLIISSNHLIFRFNQTKPCFAGHLKIGDQLQVISNDGISQAGSIVDIRLIKSQGFYAPLTHSGKLIVDGILVSNYAVVANHQLAHLVIQPYRWWISILGSSSYSENIQFYFQFLYTFVEKINKWLFSIDLYDGHIFLSSL